MTRKQQRIYAICVIVLGVTLATALAMTALRQNITFFYSPSDILSGTSELPKDKNFRLGGLVKPGSITRTGMNLNFTVTDNLHEISVTYEGIVPSLFAEGQGVVATGRMGSEGIFIASQLLAKHDENYMPPEVARSLKPVPAELAD